MSGPFGSSQWMYNAGGGFYDYEIDNSLRFNDNDSAYLVRTPASNGTRTTWTLSFWVKRCELDSSNFIFSSGSSVSNYFLLGFDNLNRLVCEEVVSGVNTWLKRSSARYRDVSSWYHVVVALDTTNGTASDRILLYVNNEEITSFDTNINPGSGNGTYWDGTTAHDIGRASATGLGYFDGYLSDVYFIDGTALDPTSFGETKSGIWIPKAYSGSYGTNGFHLEFAGNANDTSGNGNNFTANNISSYDYVPDSPTNNFATNRKGYNQTPSQGNLRFERTLNANNHTGNFPNMFAKTGKWYCELRMIDSGIDTAAFAVVEGGSYNEPADTTAYQYTVDAQTVIDGKGYYSWIINANKTDGFVQSETSYGTALTANVSAIIMCALDLENGKVWWGKDGTWFNSGDPAAGTNAAFTSSNLTDSDDGWGFASSIYTGRSNAIHIFNYGQDSTFAGNETAGGNADDNGYGDFKYAPPSGFLAMCSANLPDPAIDPAQDESPADYFDTILYTAATSNGTYTHGDLSFRPDFTWIKNRNNVEEHYLIDVVRDNTSVTNTFLRSNNTAAEGAGGVSGTTFSVTSTGYEFVETSINSGELYFNGRTYVGWNWKAGGTAISNTDGSITSSVSANTDAGFSVVGWNPSTTSTGTVGHGLGVTPKLIIAKSRSVTSDWMVMHTDLASNLILNLNSTTAAFNPGYNHFNDTYPTSSVFSIGGYLGGSVQTGDKIAYCFADVDGFSKAGSYVGNGSSDGPFVYTGFRPAWVMIKRTDGASQWFMLDSARNTYNVMDSELRANQSNAESSSVDLIDFTSNGFKIRHNASSISINESGGSFVYLAFAEQPFKYANAR